MKSVTMKDVARVANVSYTTVSRALSGSPDIGEATRQRIIKVCKEMGYSNTPPARTASPRATKTIGLIVSNFSSSFTSEIALYIEEQAWMHGYTLMLCNSSASIEKEELHYKMLIDRQVDGIIIMTSHTSTYERLLPYRGKVPTVFANEDLQDKPESYVAVNNHQGGYMGTEYLHSLGHRSIVYLGRRANKTTRMLRAQGYIDACRDYGLKPHTIEYNYTAYSMQNGYELARELFHSGGDYTAVFAATDTIALGVMRAADECGLRIPEDISLLGFDNIAFANLPRINLTTIEQPKQVIASAAMTLLMERIHFPTIGNTHKLLSPSLVIRGSCGRVNA